MPIQFGRCPVSRLPQVIAMLDAEFVFGKGRTRSLAERFPAVLSPQNAGNIFEAAADGETRSVVLVKRFRMLSGDRVLAGAMVGGVCTKPGYRGKGLASELLRHVEGQLARDGIDLGVLWARQHAFYERLGWTLGDPGVLGTATDRAGSPGRAVAPAPITPEIIVELETIRGAALSARILRSSLDYLAVPLPASGVQVFPWRDRSGSAYALVGTLGDTAYVYEVVGAPDGFDVLWRGIRGRYATVHVNASSGDEIHRWLGDRAAWMPQALAMWRVWSARVSWEEIKRMHIPYLDRI